MKTCPICTLDLNRVLLETNLPAYKCANCNGLWISANEYLSWLLPENVLSIEEIDIEQEFDVPYPISESDKAILCPDCGRFLRRFKVWPNVKFHLDRCHSCNGIWFDKNEWDAFRKIPLTWFVHWR